VPYEVKEATLKAFLGIIGLNVLDFFFHPGYWFYSSGALFFALNYIYRVYQFMGFAKMDLNEDGKTVTVKFKIGGSSTFKIRDISKMRKEKTLVETFEECYLFPISVSNSNGSSTTYYFYGSGQDAIKNGEIFRAIINGQNVKV
jgi:hypothetical protein